MRARKVIRRIWSTTLIIVGLGLLLYPFISSQIDKMRQAQLISGYNDSVSNMSDSQKSDIKDEVKKYNETLRISGLRDSDIYKDVLSIKGFMGYIDIPKINIFLPIYHNTSDYVLQNGVGHMENTSLPYGGKGTHCALTGHTGLPESMLFTNIDKLVLGDIFYIHVLDEIHAYEVDQIKTVLPNEVNDLRIEDSEDYVTLITCTPYGVNSHRLLVRGKRAPYAESNSVDNISGGNPNFISQKPLSVDTYVKNTITTYIIIGVIVFLIITIISTLFILKKRAKLTKKSFESDSDIKIERVRLNFDDNDNESGWYI